MPDEELKKKSKIKTMACYTKEKFAPFIKNTVACALTQGDNQYWTFIHSHQAGSVYDNNEMKPQLKLWKKQKVDCLKCNFKTYKFFDKTFYYFVIQPKDMDDCPIDPIGMFCDDINGDCMMVSGYGYFCRLECNREMIWNYLGSKE